MPHLVQIFAFSSFLAKQSLAVPHAQGHLNVPIPLDLVSALLHNRQSSFTNLQVPSCALGCYINTLTTDGCASETDFACHCSKGDLLGKADGCVKKMCDATNAKNARDRVAKACGAVSGGSGGGSAGNGSGDEEQATPSRSISSTTVALTSGAATPTSLSQAAPSGGTSSETPSTTNASSSLSRPTSSLTSASSSPAPTDRPFAPIFPNRQLSPGAKAGISVSVSLFAFAILLTTYLYIRRLKKDLALAKAAAGIPESVWRANIDTAAAPSGLAGQRRSWGARGRSASRRSSSSGGAESPVSPLSPRVGMEEGITGLLKKKRGQVLSIVVEREDEDTSSMHRIVHEPVPGQKEGLVNPLELDGEHTGLIELPTSITPRARSMERKRERSTSLGESSRPSTGGLEKINERQGL